MKIKLENVINNVCNFTIGALGFSAAVGVLVCCNVAIYKVAIKLIGG